MKAVAFESWVKQPDVGELGLGSGEPRTIVAFELAELLEAGEGRRVGQLVQEVDRGAVGELRVEVVERLGR